MTWSLCLQAFSDWVLIGTINVHLPFPKLMIGKDMDSSMRLRSISRNSALGSMANS